MLVDPIIGQECANELAVPIGQVEALHNVQAISQLLYEL